MQISKMILTTTGMAKQRWSHVLLAFLTAMTLSFAVTGGELLQTLLLGVPLATVFAVAGFAGGLMALCGSLAGITGVYAVTSLLSRQAPIPPAITYIAVSLGAVGLATIWRRSVSDLSYGKTSEPFPILVVPLLIALISGYVVFKWTRYTDLEFLNALAGSEDNASWLSVTRMFVSGEVTPGSLLSNINSPVSGSTLGFVSDVYWLSQFDVPEHLLALRALRSAYALIISLSAIAAGVWISVVASRAGISRWLNCVASVVVSGAVLGSSLFLLAGVGFFSFINVFMFALVTSVGLEVAYSREALTRHAETVLVLVLCGLGGVWMGASPLVVVLVVVVATTPGAGKRWGDQSRFGLAQQVVAWLLALAIPFWTWNELIGIRDKLTGKHAAALISRTGTVPIVETPWMPVIFLVVAALVTSSSRSSADWRKRSLFSLLALYAVAIWLISMLQYAEPRYAALKILVLLSLLAMTGLGIVLVERVSQLGWQAVLTGLALLLLWSSVVHESHNGIRGIGKNSSTETMQSRILETLSEDPKANIACLHQDSDLRIAAYLCSRLAASISSSQSTALWIWTEALLNSDSSPNGVELPREELAGSRVLARFREDMVESNLVLVIIGGDKDAGVNKDLGPDFWWVQELNWSQIRTVYL